jgi:hypothetical protein
LEKVKREATWCRGGFSSGRAKERARVKMKKRSKYALSRRQLERDAERMLFGTQGAASAVRRIDPATIDAAALVSQIDQQPTIARNAVRRGLLARVDKARDQIPGAVRQMKSLKRMAR